LKLEKSCEELSVWPRDVFSSSSAQRRDHKADGCASNQAVRHCVWGLPVPTAASILSRDPMGHAVTGHVRRSGGGSPSITPGSSDRFVLSSYERLSPATGYHTSCEHKASSTAHADLACSPSRTDLVSTPVIPSAELIPILLAVSMHGHRPCFAAHAGPNVKSRHDSRRVVGDGAVGLPCVSSRQADGGIAASRR